MLGNDLPATSEALIAALTPYFLIFTAFALPAFKVAKAPKYVGKAIAIVMQAIIFVMTLFTFGQVWSGRVLYYTFAAFPPPVGITYSVDFLNAFLAVLASTLFLIITPLSNHFVNDNEYFYAGMLGLEAGMLGVIYTGDIFNMFVMMEVTLISAYVVISSPRTGSSIKAAFKYAMVGTAAGMIFFLGAVMYYNALGTLNLGQGGAIIAGLIPNMGRALHPQLAIGFVMDIILFSLLAEAAVVPLHFWLPDAYSRAPPTVASLMAGLSEGISFYVIFRLFYVVNQGLTYEAFITLYVLGVITILVGGLGMIYSTDLMKIIAYSTILDVGYMAIALTFGTYGVYIALAYIFAHALVKPTLFLSAGWVTKSAGSSSLDKLKGAFKGSPALMASFLVGAAAVVGIPPTILFQAKLSLYQVVLFVTRFPQYRLLYGFYQPLTLIVMLLGSALALAGFLKAIYATYLTPGKPISGAPTYLKIVVLSLATAVIALGIAYAYVSGYLIEPAYSSLTPQHRIYYLLKAITLGGVT